MKNIVIWVLIIPIKLYQLIVSPMLPANCIYYPSCSHYFIKSLKVHGPIRGFFYGVLRIFRCSPFFKGGVDPVVEGSTLKSEFDKYKVFRRKGDR